MCIVVYIIIHSLSSFLYVGLDQICQILIPTEKVDILAYSFQFAEGADAYSPAIEMSLHKTDPYFLICRRKLLWVIIAL